MNYNFMDEVKNTLNEEFNYSMTENGALGYRTTGKALLDINFSIPEMRRMSEEDIYSKFLKAYFEDKLMAMRWLFWVRDIRGGNGERRLFRVIMNKLGHDYPEMISKLVPLIAEYGRFDDMWCLLNLAGTKKAVIDFTKSQLTADLKGKRENKSISLLAKWMPSINTSSKDTVANARILCKGLGLTERQYRKILSQLRAYLDVVERKMSAKEWDDIKYDAVPSRANLVYNSAFLRNDEARRREYLSQLEKDEVKINAGAVFPHDVVHAYSNGWYNLKKRNSAIEAMWNSLPDMVKECGNTLVVADGSGSMRSPIDAKSSVTALEVANALAIYFAERCSGQFKNKYITFSMRPQFVDFKGCESLHDKLVLASKYDECANTNIEAVFDLILDTARRTHMKQSDMPRNILIVSDMEFDSCANCGAIVHPSSWYARGEKVTPRLFKELEARYKAAGYSLPRLVFWNVNSRTGTIPVKENDMGVALVSGFSAALCKMVMSGKTNPYECLVETLMNPRYDAVEAALR